MRLTLVRPADDGEHLIVADDDGTEYELELNDALRRAAATVRPRVHADDAPGDSAPTMSPREIQQRIRGGLNAAELSELTGQPVEALQRYEAPVLAERSYVSALAQSTRIGRDADSPQLGELVTDRLAGRGADAESVVWDAWREPEEPWLVAVDYRVNGRNVRAQWSFDHTARVITALDDEARWLTETELLDVPIPKRHLSAVREADPARPLEAVRPAQPTPAPDAAPATAEPNQTELLLNDLETRRGTRDTVDLEDIDEDDDDEGAFEGFGPAVKRQREAEVGFNAPSAAHPSSSASAPEPPSAPSTAEADAASEPKKPRRGRSSVPSWDEIVFGAKND